MVVHKVGDRDGTGIRPVARCCAGGIARKIGCCRSEGFDGRRTIGSRRGEADRELTITWSYRDIGWCGRWCYAEDFEDPILRNLKREICYYWATNKKVSQSVNRHSSKNANVATGGLCSISAVYLRV